MPARPLPGPTADLDTAREDLQLSGYAVLSARLEGKRLDDVRVALSEVAEREWQDGTAFRDGGGANQRVWQLVNRSPLFRELVVDDDTLELLAALLGTHPDYSKANRGDLNFLLSNLTANIVGPGGGQMELHADQYFVPQPWPDYPLVSNVVWVLDDFTPENGATRVVPGSHAVHVLPDVEVEAVAVEAPAGSAIVLDGRLLHGTGANTSERLRRAVLAFYCAPWLRQQENYPVSVCAAAVDDATPELRELLGLKLYRNLGHYGNRF